MHLYHIRNIQTWQGSSPLQYRTLFSILNLKSFLSSLVSFSIMIVSSALSLKILLLLALSLPTSNETIKMKANNLNKINKNRKHEKLLSYLSRARKSLASFHHIKTALSSNLCQWSELDDL